MTSFYFLLRILLFSISLRVTGAKIYDSLSELKKHEFDIIICGGMPSDLLLPLERPG